MSFSKHHIHSVSFYHFTTALKSIPSMRLDTGRGGNSIIQQSQNSQQSQTQRSRLSGQGGVSGFGSMTVGGKAVAGLAGSAFCFLLPDQSF
jgi:hypothetical protein